MTVINPTTINFHSFIHSFIQYIFKGVVGLIKVRNTGVGRIKYLFKLIYVASRSSLLRHQHYSRQSYPHIMSDQCNKLQLQMKNSCMSPDHFKNNAFLNVKNVRQCYI